MHDKWGIAFSCVDPKWKSNFRLEKCQWTPKNVVLTFLPFKRGPDHKATTWKRSWKFHFTVVIKVHSDDPRLAQPVASHVWSQTHNYCPFFPIRIVRRRFSDLTSDIGTVHGTRWPAHHTSKYLTWPPQHTSVFCKIGDVWQIVAFTGSATVHACLTITSFQSLRKLWLVVPVKKSHQTLVNLVQSLCNLLTLWVGDSCGSYFYYWSLTESMCLLFLHRGKERPSST